MSNQSWVSVGNTLGYSSTNTGSALASSVTLTDVSPGANTLGQAFQFPASYITAGDLMRITAAGQYSTTSNPTLKIGVWWGGVGASVDLVDSGAVTMGTTQTGLGWMWQSTHRFMTTGTSGTVNSFGMLAYSLTSTTGSAVVGSNSSVSVDTSVAKTVTLGGQWGTNSASNTMTVYQFIVEILN